jgi:hypothetical protein
MKASKLLVIIAVLQGLILLGQWTGVGLQAPAQAQIPHARAQRTDVLGNLEAHAPRLAGLPAIHPLEWRRRAR